MSAPVLSSADPNSLSLRSAIFQWRSYHAPPAPGIPPSLEPGWRKLLIQSVLPASCQWGMMRPTEVMQTVWETYFHFAEKVDVCQPT